METGMRAKLLARQMEALLDCEPPRSGEATGVYREARKLGLFELRGKGAKALVAKFASLAMRLPGPLPEEPTVERSAPLKELISMLLSCKQCAATGQY